MAGATRRARYSAAGEEAALPAVTTVPPAAPATRDETAARRDLRDQIARLERDLARAVADAFPRREPARAGRPAAALAGPRLVGLGQLERIRDELAARIVALGDDGPRRRLEAMHAAPHEHRWACVTSAELGEPGCAVWQVRPRLGLLGMLMGWWRVKLSSGCPLAG